MFHVSMETNQLGFHSLENLKRKLMYVSIDWFEAKRGSKSHAPSGCNSAEEVAVLTGNKHRNGRINNNSWSSSSGFNFHSWKYLGYFIISGKTLVSHVSFWFAFSDWKQLVSFIFSIFSKSISLTCIKSSAKHAKATSSWLIQILIWIILVHLFSFMSSKGE